MNKKFKEVDKQQPDQKTCFVSSCSLHHNVQLIAFSGQSLVKKRLSMNKGLPLVRAKHVLKNQKRAFGKKSRQEKHSHDKQL